MLQARAEGAKAWMPPALSTGLMRFPYKDFAMIEEEDPMKGGNFIRHRADDFQFRQTKRQKT